jgi:hypothetical protein
VLAPDMKRMGFSKPFLEMLGCENAYILLAQKAFRGF